MISLTCDEDTEKRTLYKTYLLQMLFMDMDEVIDSSPPLTYEEFCEELKGERNGNHL